MAATLYAIPGSHPSRTGEPMLSHKGIDPRRVNLVPRRRPPYALLDRALPL